MLKPKPLVLPKRGLILPNKRRGLPDARFPHIWVPRRTIIRPQMAVALDAKSTAAVDQASPTSPFSISANITVGSSLTNGFLLAIVFWDILATGTSAVWDNTGTNQAMTSVGAATNTTGALRAEMFEVVSPTAGNKLIKVTWTGAATEVMIAAISFTGVNQASPTANFTSTSNGSLAANATASLTVTAGTSDAVVAGWLNDFTWAASPTNQTALCAAVNGNTIAGAWNYVVPSAASNSMTCTNGGTADDYCSLAVDVVAAAAGAVVEAAGITIYRVQRPTWR